MKSRSPGQTLIGVAVDATFLREIDAKRGGLSRSAFVRMCLAKYLNIPESLAAAPDRTGKGGRPKKELEAVKGTGEPPAKRVRA